ncbi:MAG: phosphate ABC transporter permease PstA [Pseudomonadota bacterium]
MSDATLSTGDAAGSHPTSTPVRDFGIRRRRAAETRFKVYGLLAITIAVCFLVLLMYSIISKGITGFYQTEIKLEITLDEAVLDPDGLRNAPNPESFNAHMFAFKTQMALPRIVQNALLEELEIDPLDDELAPLAKRILSVNAHFAFRDMVLENPDLIGGTHDLWFYARGDIDAFLKGAISRDTPNEIRQVKDAQIEMLDQLVEAGRLEKRFNWGLITQTSSPYAENAGLSVAIYGSLLMMLIVLVLALPIGVAASIYLEEFAPKNRFTDLIEVNINNLAAVPSIVFGILGLAVFINFAGLPRSTPIVGGLVLTLMTLPTVIIATRAALKAVPPSVREAALGVGASKMQSVFHHVLPLAMPGILTGTIIGLAQALGETAPLLIIGMDASVNRMPDGPLDPATSIPSQIYNWSRASERAFVERTSAAIIVLLMVLAMMNILAVLLRRRFERRW